MLPDLHDRRLIARTLLGGHHGFQYSWPAWSEAEGALAAILNSEQGGVIAMLHGPSGSGITSLLSAFVERYPDDVIHVRNHLFLQKVSLIERVQDASAIRGHDKFQKRVPQSLIEFSKLTRRRIIVIDDTETIADKNLAYDDLVEDMRRLAESDANFSVIFSSRQKHLQKLFRSIKGMNTIDIPMHRAMSSKVCAEMMDAFWEWNDSRFGLNTRRRFDLELLQDGDEFAVDRVMASLELIYSAELLSDQLNDDVLRYEVLDDGFKFEVERIAYS